MKKVFLQFNAVCVNIEHVNPLNTELNPICQ